MRSRRLAYRWFCGLSIEDKIPDHSAFTRARNERFRDGGRVDPLTTHASRKSAKPTTSNIGCALVYPRAQ
ncbi:transposase [Dongia deserti]|uniref:transposase n=1 Tax=Dongia deserti TaxID=2268030 RepID=UPI0038991B9A